MKTATEEVFFSTGTRHQSLLCCFQKKGVCQPQHTASLASAYSPGFALANFFLFWRVNKELMDLSLGRDSLKVTLVDVMSSVWARSMDMDMQHVHENAAWRGTCGIEWTCSMDMDINHGHGHSAWTWACSIKMDMNIHHGHGQAAWTWTCSKDKAMQHGHIHVI